MKPARDFTPSPRHQASALQRDDDLIGLGEAILFLLREDECAVDDDVELADLPRFELAVDSICLFDCGRETRGPRLVVSDEAVLDADVHLPTMVTVRTRCKGLRGRAAGPNRI